MGLNPKGFNYGKILDDHFNEGSPYISMYHCGYYGVPFEECVAKCQRNGIAIRRKDIENYQAGAFKSNVAYIAKTTGLAVEDLVPGPRFEDMKLADFPLMPKGWNGTEQRFFPCTADNKPMAKWGWSRDYVPELYTASDARALSPCGWIGQNMLYQKFIVLDIDGVGHGTVDKEVIEFGSAFRSKTMMMEDPAKQGSFHLYFATDRLIPVKHFPWAKLDLMGNAGNYAVYFKNKKWNGIQMMDLNEEIWQEMMSYQTRRRENVCH